ncbi:hypothetical protein [Bacillus andreraoultii]|nr:hypothetical protein [Bacillus andreraoultii]
MVNLLLGVTTTTPVGILKLTTFIAVYTKNVANLLPIMGKFATLLNF